MSHPAATGRGRAGQDWTMSRLQSTLVPTLFVCLASIMFGSVPFFAKQLTADGMAPPAIAMARYVLTSLAFLPFLRLKDGMWRATLWGYVTGIGMSVGWIGYVEALDLMPVATVAVIYMTFPLFTIGIGWAFFGDRPGRRSLIAACLIVVAAALVLRPDAVGVADPMAILVVFITPVTFGFAINVLTHKLTSLPSISRMASVSLGSSSGLLPLVLALPMAEIIPASTLSWVWIGGMSIISALIPQLLYTTYVPRIGAAKAAMAGSVELPTSFLVGWLAFGEVIGWPEAIAAILILTAIAVTPARRVAGITTRITTRARAPDHPQTHPTQNRPPATDR